MLDIKAHNDKSCMAIEPISYSQQKFLMKMAYCSFSNSNLQLYVQKIRGIQILCIGWKWNRVKRVEKTVTAKKLID